jgi:hypothetical protein
MALPQDYYIPEETIQFLIDTCRNDYKRMSKGEVRPFFQDLVKAIIKLYETEIEPKESEA